MVPNPQKIEYLSNENEPVRELFGTDPPSKRTYEYRLLMIIVFILIHVQGLYGMYLSFTSAKFYTNIFAIVCHCFAGFSVVAGAHRLWAHRAYKATWQLKLILMISNVLAFQDSLYLWCRNHRIHHKYTDTDSDPHDSRRGFFYSHIGWLLIKPHPEYLAKLKSIDMSDLKRDPFVRFQTRYYNQLLILFFFVFQTVIPWYFWNETIKNGWFVCVCYRHMLTLNGSFLVNSWAHVWGTQPYDAGSTAREHMVVALIAMGEGWHNFHHAFPWDYRTSELGGGHLSPVVIVLNLLSKIGWVYDMKTVSNDIIKKRIKRTGDGTHQNAIWGWGDHEQSEENKSFVRFVNKR